MKSATSTSPAPTWPDVDFAAFDRGYREFPELRLATDVSRIGFPDGYFGSAEVQKLLKDAFALMARIEAGEKVNGDEKDDQGQPGRMVGHYWLRAPERAPTPEITEQIRAALTSLKRFTRAVHSGRLRGASGPFRNVLVIGIGGSALGPQFVAKALGDARTDRMKPWFFDNTDPDGMDRVLDQIGRDPANLGATLCVVISKSGTTPETKNGLEEAKAAYAVAGLAFSEQALAITQVNSALDKEAAEPGHEWLARLPMWDWVGGRTSETSAVGLLPAALQGIEIDGLLQGAAACDRATRVRDPIRNPAALLALVWYFCGQGHGAKDLVVIPYKDRLDLFSRYLQQLIMESLGKELDATNQKVVNQGIAVYGNKGSTDQHAYVQQLREGLNNFFAIFIEVLSDREGASKIVDTTLDATSGDYLSGFLLGTRKALKEKDRASMTITVNAVTPFTVGVLIALFERAVGLYASFIGINAYHQPGVQAGKEAATAVLKIQREVLKLFAGHGPVPCPARVTASDIARAIGNADAAETVFKICQRLSINGGRGIRRVSGTRPADIEFAPE